MMRKLLLLISLIILGSAASIAQTGSIKITLTDKSTSEPVSFATITLLQNGRRVAGNTTNLEGELTFAALSPGSYDVSITSIGYAPKMITGVRVNGDKPTYIKEQMETGGAAGTTLKDVIIKAYQPPLINESGSSGTDVSGIELGHMVSHDPTQVAAGSAGTFSADAGGAISIRGSRAEGTAYYVDGQRLPPGSSLGVADLGIDGVSTITGGVPARYGDVTGGIISVTTKGVRPNFFASVQAESSQYLDQYGKNYLGFSLGSPLYSLRDTSGKKTDVVGFILSGDFSHVQDPVASTVSPYAVNSTLLNQIQQNPIMLSSNGITNVRTGEFVTGDQISTLSQHQNVANTNVNLNGKLKFRLSENSDLTLGTTYNYNMGNGFVYEYELFNPSHNPQTIYNSLNINGRFIQRFNTKTADEKDKTSSVIKNAVYTLQSDYGTNNSVTQDPTYTSNIFQYGYVGKFDIINGKQNYWVDGANNTGAYQSNYIYDPTKRAFVQQGLPGDSIIRFTPNQNNLSAANYTTDYFNLRGSDVHNFSEIQSGLGLLNGDRPQNIYSLWYPTGRVYDGYSKGTSSQFRVLTSFQALIKDHHNVEVGFEFQQQSQSSFAVTPIELWRQMRTLEGNVLQQLDTAHPIVSQQGAYKYISYNPLYNSANQSQFDRSLRQKLGLPINSTQILNIDGMNPNTFNLGMFSADDLLNNGSPLVTYQGYDYAGNKLTNNPSFASFFTAQDANGNYLRQIAPYQPIYLAGYIEDQFDIADLKIRAGLRVDRFDNNQMELKDLYTLYNVKTAGELNGTALGAGRPSNIPNNFVAYADNATSPNTIVGYRDPNTGGNGITAWYTPQGVLVNDPSILAKNANLTQIYPILENPNAQKTSINPNAFQAYVAQWNVLPRLAFTFPISDLASFNANYDIYSQRPTVVTNNASPYQYLQWYDNIPSMFMANPSLKPQQVINYELGYSQYLNDKRTVSFKISAFYREMRDMIQVIGMYNAFPATYTTYGNLDFATVKGLSASFDTRRIGNIQLHANYTLQFADGTGSGAGDAINLVNSGVPNLRVLAPLSYDRRHTFNVTLDYRYGEGKEYNGPVWLRHKGKDNEKTIKLLENVGLNLFATAGSGTPYSRQANVTQGDASGIPVAVGIGQRGSLAGTINGSVLPWSYRLDLKIDKQIRVTWKAENEAEHKPAKVGMMNVYIRSVNLLNTQNILAVYKYTGNPNDDGFLASPTGQQYVAAQNSPASFAALYGLKVNNPTNYSMPRSVMVGVILNY